MFCAVCCWMFTKREPSLTQELLLPAALYSANLLKIFSWRAYWSVGGAMYSPSTHMKPMSTTPAIPALPARRTVETPAARMTVSSLSRASVPRPRMAPISAAIGRLSNSCWGSERAVKTNALPTS